MKAITLADGPHMLDVPRVPQFTYLQRLGYAFRDAFTSRALLIHIGGEGDEAEYDPNLEAIADHLCALLVAAEPQAGWTPEKVADAMQFEHLADYFTTLRDLATEGAGDADPKASSATTPEPTS